MQKLAVGVKETAAAAMDGFGGKSEGGGGDG